MFFKNVFYLQINVFIICVLRIGPVPIQGAGHPHNPHFWNISHHHAKNVKCLLFDRQQPGVLWGVHLSGLCRGGDLSVEFSFVLRFFYAVFGLLVPVSFAFRTTVQQEMWTQQLYVVYVCDFTKFGECLENVDWLSVVHNNLTPDDLWSAFCEVLRSIADVCVPVKQAIPSKKNTSIKHYPYSIQRATARKRLLWPQSQLQVKFIFSIAE